MCRLVIPVQGRPVFEEGKVFNGKGLVVNDMLNLGQGLWIMSSTYEVYPKSLTIVRLSLDTFPTEQPRCKLFSPFCYTFVIVPVKSWGSVRLCRVRVVKVEWLYDETISASRLSSKLNRYVKTAPNWDVIETKSGETFPTNWGKFHDVCVKCRMLMAIILVPVARTRPRTHTKWLISRTPTTWMPFFLPGAPLLARVVFVSAKGNPPKKKMSWKTRYTKSSFR
jgi:hypothetical protein